MIKLKESLLVPCEGIFWIINNKLVAFTDNVNPKKNHMKQPIFFTKKFGKQ